MVTISLLLTIKFEYIYDSHLKAMSRQSLRNAINRSKRDIPNYRELSKREIHEIQYVEDCISSNKKLKRIKICVKSSVKCERRGSPKMRFKLNNKSKSITKKAFI